MGHLVNANALIRLGYSRVGRHLGLHKESIFPIFTRRFSIIRFLKLFITKYTHQHFPLLCPK